MRDIKFRAWDNSTNHWLDMFFFFNFIDGKLEYTNKDDVVIEQYAGLKDKNGVEIYEGDLIEAKNATYKVEWFNTAFLVAPILGYGNSQPISKLYDYEENNKLKVIGNIHDNAYLLEETK